MDKLQGLIDRTGSLLSAPVNRDLPLGKLLAYFVLFLIIGFWTWHYMEELKG